MNLLRIGPAVVALALLGACASSREAPPPAPAPAPPPVRPVVAPPVPVVPATPWIDAALTPGDWTQEAREARYGRPGAPSFALRCASPGQIVLVRFGASASPAMTVRTSSAMRTLPARAVPGAVEASLASSDPLLDAMLYSRGRYSIEVAGLERLIVPSWPEPGRVVEDCRG